MTAYLTSLSSFILTDHDKQDISTSLRNYFCTSLSPLPSIPSLKDYLTQPFDNKIPIESHFYKEWKQAIGDMVDEHFINGDVARVYW